VVALKRELRKIQKHRGVLRANRHSGPLVALVGYTNAGKSALLNGLTGATIESQDRLFCTLDSTMRASRVCVGGHRAYPPPPSQNRRFVLRRDGRCTRQAPWRASAAT
jgi:50S ribosomal subunit-associated GTPase HflX